MTPPERLRVELKRQRERGRTFKVAWRIGVSQAVRDLPFPQQRWWRDVFREQRTHWLLSYDRRPWPATHPRCLEPMGDYGLGERPAAVLIA